MIPKLNYKTAPNGLPLTGRLRSVSSARSGFPQSTLDSTADPPSMKKQWQDLARQIQIKSMSLSKVHINSILNAGFCLSISPSQSCLRHLSLL